MTPLPQKWREMQKFLDCPAHRAKYFCRLFIILLDEVLKEPTRTFVRASRLKTGSFLVLEHSISNCKFRRGCKYKKQKDETEARRLLRGFLPSEVVGF